MTAIAEEPISRTAKERWNTYVVLAREHVRAMQRSRAQIAELAIAACTGTKKGVTDAVAFTRGVYTYKRFAIDIGVNPKSLRRWVQIKQEVIDKLPTYNDSVPGNWNAADATHRALKSVGCQDPEAVKSKFKAVRAQLADGSDPAQLTRYRTFLHSITRKVQSFDLAADREAVEAMLAAVEELAAALRARLQ